MSIRGFLATHCPRPRAGFVFRQARAAPRAHDSKDSSLALIADTWTVYDDAIAPITTFAIEANSSFFAQNVTGCATTGRVSIIDSRYNVYGVETTVTGCPIAGEDNGLGTLGDLARPNDAFVLSMSNDARALLVLLQR